MKRLATDVDRTSAPEVLDLRGVACPLNWAKARVRLEAMNRGATLELIVDDPRAVRDIPRAAEALGYDVGDPAREGSAWRLPIYV